MIVLDRNALLECCVVDPTVKLSTIGCHIPALEAPFVGPIL